MLTMLLNIYNGTFCKNSKRLLAIDYFYKKLHLGVLQGSDPYLTQQ